MHNNIDLFEKKGYISDFHVDYLHSFIGGHSGGSHVAVAQFQVRYYFKPCSSPLF
jgi:hypothetical protein